MMASYLPFDIVSYYQPYLSLESVWPVSIQAFHVTAEDGHRVSSVEEAEDQLLAALGHPTGFCYLPREPSTWCGDGTLSVMIAINRGSNLISARTRLGTADTVLMSPMGLEVLLDHSSRCGAPGTFSLTDEPPKIGRWRQVGKLWTGQNVFVGTHLPDDHVYVVRTAGDDHAALIHEDGRLYLVTDVAASFVRSVDFFYSLSVQPCCYKPDGTEDDYKRIVPTLSPSIL